MSAPVTVIIGVGPGNGLAFARRFGKEGHRLALLSRSESKVQEAASQFSDAMALACDASDPAALAAALGQVEAQLGPVQNLLYNAGSGLFGDVDAVALSDLESAWRLNALGLVAAAQAVLPGMRAKSHGNIIVTGATASLRGGARFLAFAQAKAAQRSIAQSLARKLGPEGIHVALVIVDGMVDGTRSRQMVPDLPDEAFMQPADIADAVWFLTQQARSAWTFELDLRPSAERW